MKRSRAASDRVPSDHITPYDRFAWSDDDVERLLVSGKHRRELTGYFGPREYRELRALAARAKAAVPMNPAVPVFVVPGMMGTQLGVRRRRPLPNDILWLDPIDIGAGNLAALRLPPRAPVVPLGVVLYSYLRLKLHLRASGFVPLLHEYDWRLGMDRLGTELARKISQQRADRVMIVAHSMGGLVSRAALAHPGTARVARLVLLGTPNFGSFAPLQALRGTYSVVRKIAQLTHTGSAESLARNIFKSFPSLYQMLPGADEKGVADWLDARQWPRSGPQPDRSLLRKARALQDLLAKPDDRFTTIVGVGEETVTSAVKRADQLVYTITRHGDGTVPATSAALAGAKNYFALAPHSELTRDSSIGAAVAELLHTGTTKRLPDHWNSSSVAKAHITERQLRALHLKKVDWAALTPEERRAFLENLNEPPKLRLRRLPAHK